MNRPIVDRIADAVLYEGYVLYPYRPSVKNRQRWSFGVLYPEARARLTDGGDAASNRTECLVRGDRDTRLSVKVRFLHLMARTVGRFDPPLEAWPESDEPAYLPVDSLHVEARQFHTWQEAEERQVTLPAVAIGDLLRGTLPQSFSFPGSRRLEPVYATDGTVPGVLVREQQTVDGVVQRSAVEVAAGVFRVALRVSNGTPMSQVAANCRDAALLRSLASTHAVLGVTGGAFESLLDPPADCVEAAAGCRNVGAWPVLVGEDGQTDTMLAAPIILYDYPRVAPESPGDFFDGTEIDEMLTLRVLTMTPEEKQAMAAVDDRTRALLARTEAMAREQLFALHGALRPAAPAAGEAARG